MEEIDNINTKTDLVEFLEKINNSYEDRIIIHRLIYSNDNSYNNDIVDYINGLEHISYDEKVELLKYLNFTVLEDGTVKW